MSSVTFTNMGSNSIKAARARSVGTLTLKVTQAYQRLWRDAARVFVLTAVDTIVSNIRSTEATGMTVASFRSIAGELRIKNQIIAAFQGFGPKFYGYNYEGKNSKGGNDLGASHEGPRGNKSKARGELMGRKAYRITFGSKNRLLMTFEFQPVVYQHLYWESSWGSMEAGRVAMIQFIEENATQAPYNVAPLAVRWFTGGQI